MTLGSNPNVRPAPVPNETGTSSDPIIRLAAVKSSDKRKLPAHLAIRYSVKTPTDQLSGPSLITSLKYSSVRLPPGSPVPGPQGPSPGSPEPPGALPLPSIHSSQDVSLPLVLARDCEKIEIKFSILQGQNCLIDVVSSENPKDLFIMHGNQIIIYGFNSPSWPPGGPQIVYTYNLVGYVSSNYITVFPRETPTLESITFGANGIPQAFNIFSNINLPAEGTNMGTNPSYLAWINPGIDMNLWFGRRYNHIPMVEGPVINP